MANTHTFLFTRNAIITTFGVCNCIVWQLVLVGACGRAGENWTKIAVPYWPGTVRPVGDLFRDVACQCEAAKTVHRNGCLANGEGSVLDNMNNMGLNLPDKGQPILLLQELPPEPKHQVREHHC